MEQSSDRSTCIHIIRRLIAEVLDEASENQIRKSGSYKYVVAQAAIATHLFLCAAEQKKHAV